MSGKSGNAQSEVHEVLTKNGKRVPTSNKGEMREGARARVCGTGVQTLSQQENAMQVQGAKHIAYREESEGGSWEGGGRGANRVP